MTSAARLLVFLGGLAGAAGVALSAVAAHAGGAGLDIAASFLIVHAAALLGVAALVPTAGRMALAGGVVMAVGLALFCGDLASRAFLDDRLFAMAAPAGGSLLIAGWLLVAVSALWTR